MITVKITTGANASSTVWDLNPAECSRQHISITARPATASPTNSGTVPPVVRVKPTTMPTQPTTIASSVSGKDPHGAGGRSRCWTREGRGRGLPLAGGGLDALVAVGADGAAVALDAAPLAFARLRLRERLLTLGRATPARYREEMARKTIDQLLTEARERLRRVEPEEAFEAASRGAILVDIRSGEQRAADGVLPGAIHHPRNVLEWRADPTSGASDPAIADPDAELILVCNEGYASSLAAVTLQELGFTRATDLAGGFQAWRAAGLPVERL